MILRHAQNTTSRAKGFTLIEIMVVVAILVILVGLVVAVGSNVQQKAKIQTTKTLLIGYDRSTSPS